MSVRGMPSRPARRSPATIVPIDAAVTTAFHGDIMPPGPPARDELP